MSEAAAARVHFVVFATNGGAEHIVGETGDATEANRMMLSALKGGAEYARQAALGRVVPHEAPHGQ